MKVLLAMLSGLFLLLALPLLFWSLEQLDQDYDAETSSECTTAPPVTEGGTVTEQCTGTDETGGVQVLALYGAGFLVSGSLLAVAAVNVRHPEERPAPAPWQGGPPRR